MATRERTVHWGCIADARRRSSWRTMTATGGSEATAPWKLQIFALLIFSDPKVSLPVSTKITFSLSHYHSRSAACCIGNLVPAFGALDHLYLSSLFIAFGAYLLIFFFVLIVLSKSYYYCCWLGAFGVDLVIEIGSVGKGLNQGVKSLIDLLRISESCKIEARLALGCARVGLIAITALESFDLRMECLHGVEFLKSDELRTEINSNEKKVAKWPNNRKRIQQPATQSLKEAAQPSQPQPDNHNNKTKENPQTEPKLNNKANGTITLLPKLSPLENWLLSQRTSGRKAQ
ncbi:Serine/threonine-protein kinase [Spatholobus suberectus]|nr:Serine/threonine-protein kinase [Spatholobus suberectus]